MSAVAAVSTAAPRASFLKRLSSQEALLGLAIVLLAVVVGIINPRFLAARNLSDILLGNAYIAVAAIGMSMVIISGNIDISVGALIGVLATISGSMAVAGYSIALSWLVPVLVGVGVMALQGVVVAYLRIPAIVVTLGMLSILKGGLISVTGGKRITDLPDSFHLADIELFDILPMPVVIMVAATILAALWMRSSAPGRAIYATGGKPRSRAPRRNLAEEDDRDGVRAAWVLRRTCGAAVRDPAQGHPVDRAAQPRTDHHHRLGRRRRQHSGRRRHRSRFDLRRDPDRGNRQRARVRQHLALSGSAPCRAG